MFVFLGIRETDHNDNNKRKKGLEQKNLGVKYFIRVTILYGLIIIFMEIVIKKPSLKMSFFEIF